MPIVLGYAPIGLAYGLLGQQTGLGAWPTVGMSLLVFSGAAQFMAISMFFRGADALVVIGTTFIVNFRHVLMSASLAPLIGGWNTSLRAAFGLMLTDESFAIHSASFPLGEPDPAEAIALNVTAYIAWAASGLAGYYLGALIESPEAWGLDFALPAMFIGLLLPACRDKPAVTAALCGGAVSVAVGIAGMRSWAAFIGAVAGATAGVLVMEGRRQ
jgi:4-azaleucine resistance transporter AzlC